jgi:hypothetical protein
MRETQDIFFDEVYWQPAARAADNFGIQSALGVAVVYDSWVHGSWKALREMTNQKSGPIATLGERPWIKAYVENRRSWLANHRRSDLQGTTYRMDAFLRLIEQGYWGLALPLVVRGEEISLATLRAVRPYVTLFSSAGYTEDLVNGALCVSMGWSGDINGARMKAQQAKTGQRIEAHTVAGLEPKCDPNAPPDADLTSTLSAEQLQAIFDR